MPWCRVLGWWLGLGACAWSGASRAQDGEPATTSSAEANAPSPSASEIYGDLSLLELLEMDVSVASRTAEPLREAPAVISVLTREDILRNGCRDLIDVFNMIPGFSITTDAFETGALNVRGLYGFEGRALIMVDGMQMNDNLFGTYVLGNGFPIHLIEKIEVVRGPGSVVRGGAAELAVVNIITASLDTVSYPQKTGAARVGILSTGQVGHQDVGFNVAHHFEDFSVSALGFAGSATKGTSSDRRDELIDTDPTFPGYPLNAQTYGNGNLALAGQFVYQDKLILRTVYQSYTNNFMETFFNEDLGTWEGNGEEKATLFEVFNVSVSAPFQLSPEVKTTAGLAFHYDRAWWNKYPTTHERPPAKPTLRYNPHLITEFTTERVRAVLGTEMFVDVATSSEDEYRGEPYRPFSKPYDEEYSRSLSIWNAALFSSISYAISEDVRLLGGVRFDGNELAGFGTSPRAGVAWTRDGFHSKLLYSEAFRAPNIANSVDEEYSLNVPRDAGPRFDIKKEKTRTGEIELGYVFDFGLSLRMNGFIQAVVDIIEFNPDYDFLTKNGGTQGSSGVEGEIKLAANPYRGLFNISYVEPGTPAIEDGMVKRASMNGKTYLTPKSGSPFFLGVPKLKLYTSHSFDITDKVFVNTNLLLYGTRYQHRYDDSFNEGSERLAPSPIVGLGLTFRDVMTRGLAATFRVHDLFDQQLKYVSSFNSNLYNTHPFSSVNHKGRELSLNLQYTH